MTNVWCVRAEFGKYAQTFGRSGYAAIGLIENRSLADRRSREKNQVLYRAACPNDTSNIVIGQQAGQIVEIEPGDIVITPESLMNGEQLVDLLVEHWDAIPEEFQERLALKRGLVLA